MADWTERFSLAGRMALITGASDGIGAEIARVYADAGASLIISGRDASKLSVVEEQIRDSGAECRSLVSPLETAEGASMLAEEALRFAGTIDILVNSAGVALINPATELSIEDWDLTMAVNLRAPFILAKMLAPGMIQQRWGKIINISSQTGVIALADHAAYASSKGGLNALTKSLMAEWARHNIQVNAICPTVVLTPMGEEIWSPEEKRRPFIENTPLGRFGQPVEIADLALYLASPAAELVNGSTIMIDGGYSSV